MQFGLLESIIGLLAIDKWLIVAGILIIGITVYGFYKFNIRSKALKIGSYIIYYYYLCIILNNIIGMPSIKEILRLKSLGEHIFNPNVNLVPLADGANLAFILNIFCFIPLGLLTPFLSDVFKKGKNILLLGFLFSLTIEISQMFTLYRVSDIDDLITNVIGTMLGFLGYNFIHKLRTKEATNVVCENTAFISYLPVFYIVFVVVVTFVTVW